MAPIIFCHYGVSNYLEYTLISAKLFNPQKEIILLGDDSNKNIAIKCGAFHINFNSFDSEELVVEFNIKFKFISGNNHGRPDWTKFVFLRWIYVREFIKKYNIDSFWHFDSDNFITIDLNEKERIFSKYDNTEQCGGICLNGFISSSQIVESYVSHILNLFGDEEYIKIQLEKCKSNDNFAFTEMAAYNDFKKKFNPNSIRLNSIICNETFDDCLAIPDGMEQTSNKFNNYNIKQIYSNKQNVLFFKQYLSDRFIQINSLNLSWMPFFVIRRIFCLLLRKKSKYFRVINFFKKEQYFKIDLNHYSLTDRVIDKILLFLLKSEGVS